MSYEIFLWTGGFLVMGYIASKVWNTVSFYVSFGGGSDGGGEECDGFSGDGSSGGCDGGGGGD